MKSSTKFGILLKIAFIFTLISCTTGHKNNKNVGKADLPIPDILYFGWFVNQTTSESLKKITDLYFNSIIEQVDSAKYFMEQISQEQNVSSIAEYFTKPLDPASGNFDPFYHITAIFCGDKDCTDYYNRFESELGKTFKTELVGVFFTERTFGIRIALSTEQEKLFDVEKSVQKKVVKKKGTTNNQYSDAYPGISFEQQDMNFQPTKSRAHITLACGPGVPAVETGFDLLKIIDYEANIPNEIKHEEFVLDDSMGNVRNYYKWNSTTNQNETLAFVLYPTYKMVLNTKFKAYSMRNNISSNSRPYYVLVLLLSLCMY